MSHACHGRPDPLHTHSFVEVAFAVGGAGTLAFSLPPASTRRE